MQSPREVKKSTVQSSLQPPNLLLGLRMPGTARQGPGCAWHCIRPCLQGGRPLLKQMDKQTGRIKEV